MAGGESKGSHRYDKENLLWQSTVAIKSDPVGFGKNVAVPRWFPVKNVIQYAQQTRKQA